MRLFSAALCRRVLNANLLRCEWISPFEPALISSETLLREMQPVDPLAAPSDWAATAARSIDKLILTSIKQQLD